MSFTLARYGNIDIRKPELLASYKGNASSPLFRHHSFHSKRQMPHLVVVCKQYKAFEHSCKEVAAVSINYA